MDIRRSQLKYADVIILIALFLLTLILLVPFRSQILHHWDSVNFALALEQYDIKQHQPHPPGTFAIYIFLGRIINFFLNNPNDSLVWLSIMSNGLSVMVIYYLGMTWFNRSIGLICALLFISSPLIWFHGEIALAYAPELFVVLMIVLISARLRTGNIYVLYGSALLLGLSGGIRPNTPIFLFPLWVFLARKYTLRRILNALFVMALGVAVWAIPTIIYAGGVDEYITIIQAWRSSHTEESGSLFAMIVNGGRLAVFTLYSVGLSIFAIFYILVRYRQKLLDLLRIDWRAQILALWIIPAIFYYVVIHLKQSGHIFTILPALIIISSLSIFTTSRSIKANHLLFGISLVCLVVFSNSLFFLLGPSNILGSSRMLFNAPTYANIRNYDEEISLRLETIRNHFRPEETVVIAGSRNFRIPDFYLADYQLPSISSHLNQEIIVFPDNVRNLVLFDDAVLPSISSELAILSLPMAEGENLRYFSWNENQKIGLSQTVLDIQER